MTARAHRPGIHVALALVALVAAVVALEWQGRTADAAPTEIVRSGAGPLGSIGVIGDSVMLGSLITYPTLPDRLVDAGWGSVRARAGESYWIGRWDTAETTNADYWIERWRGEGWDPDAVVVNLGANDAGGCRENSGCAYDAITYLADVIGPGKRIWWPKITRRPHEAAYEQTWNAALDRVADERPNFFTWDWPAVMEDIGQYYGDNIHQTAAGYRERSVRMAGAITATLGRARQIGDPAPLPTTAAAPTSEMVALDPVRALDTRERRGRLGAGETVQVDVPGDVPTGATAVAAYITAAAPTAPGHLSAHPCGRSPTTTSFVNHPARTTRGASAVVPLSVDGTFCVTSHADTDVVVDLQAAFVAGSAAGALRFTPLAAPERLIDTRGSGRTRHVELEVPDGAEAVAVNIVAVQASKAGHVTASACGSAAPEVANLNHLADEAVASAAYVPVSDNGTICLSAHAAVHLVVDLTGVFVTDGDLAFVPVAPRRTLDTRDGTGGWAPVHGAEQTIEVRVAPADAEAVTGSLTVVRPVRSSHLRAWSCGDRPDSSNVNAGPGAIRANSVTTGIDAGRLCVYAASTGQTVFDTTGWWVR